MRNDQSHKIKLLKVHNATYATLLKIEVRSTSQRLQPYHSKKLAFDLNIGLDIHCRRFTVRSARIWTRNSVWIRWVIVMMVQLKSDRMTSSKWVWVQKMCEWSGISSQEIFKKKHKQQQFFSIEKNLTDFQSTCCPRKGVYISMIWHAGLVNVLTDRVRCSLRSSTPPDSFWKGETKQKTCFSCCLDIQLIDKILQQFCVPLICRVAYLLAINSGMRCPGNCIHHLVHQYQLLKRSGNLTYLTQFGCLMGISPAVAAMHEAGKGDAIRQRNSFHHLLPTWIKFKSTAHDRKHPNRRFFAGLYDLGGWR